MFKKTLTAAVAALTLAGASLTTIQPAQAGFGKMVAAVAVGAVVGGALASSARSEPAYEPGYRGARFGGCGTRPSPIFDEYGNRIGFRRVPAC